MTEDAGEWGVLLNDVYLSGRGVGQVDLSGIPIPATEDPAAILSAPPDGLGLPGLRVEDVAYPQRDGVRHFKDWYEPRIITLENVTVSSDDCSDCPSTRAKVREIVNAWSRHCDDTELVIFTDCNGQADDSSGYDRGLVGPFGVRGRPRVAEVTWARNPKPVAELTLRFDAVDHRLFILDEYGTPGSGTQCVTLTPDSQIFCRSYPRCYPLCYVSDNSNDGAGPVVANVDGDICVRPTITLHGRLTDPRVENQTTGESITFSSNILEGQSVVIDTYDGTATIGGVSRTFLLEGSVRMALDPGPNTLQLRSFGSNDTGYAEVCWRPAVLSG